MQNYTYDPVNRILTANEAAGANWSRTYDYDPYGNRAVIANSGLPTSPLMPGTLAAFSTANNQITLAGTNYDSAGNQTATALNETLVYDANNHQTSYFDPISAVTTTYEYDGQGNRVKKIAPSKTGIYVYDAFGKLAAEYSTVAPSDPGTHYPTVDHLGSTRLVTDAIGAEIERRDYLPFGEEVPSTVGNRGTGSTSTLDDRHRFTGKERDTESQLDYFLARYYSSPMGRFLSVDPENAAASVANPQFWNAYAYADNSPLRYVDPDGRAPVDAVIDMAAVDKVVRPLIESVPKTAPPPPKGPPAPGGSPGLGGAVVRGLGLIVGVLLSPAQAGGPDEIEFERKVREREEKFEQQQREQERQEVVPKSQPAPQSADHRKNKRKSNKPRHERGNERRRRDQGGEDGDVRRRAPRRRPPGHKGPYPPKRPKDE